MLAAQVPSIEGQPTWVVIVVALIGLLSALGVAYLASKMRSTPSAESPAATVTTTESESDLSSIVKQAMETLTQTARLEAEENRELHAQLRRALKQLAKVERNLDRCQHRVRSLTVQLRGEQSDA